MDRPEFLNHLNDLLELEPGTLKGTERLKDLDGWNSLAVIGFMAFANDEFGVVLSPKKISASETTGDLVSLLIPG